MKAPRVQIFISLMILSGSFFSAMTNEVINGVVTDSLTNVRLNTVGVKVALLSCSTFTNSTGEFTLNIPSQTIISSPGLQSVLLAKDVWSSDRGAFLHSGRGVDLEVRNTRGKLVAHFTSIENAIKKLPPGMYVAILKQTGYQYAFKILNFPHSFQSFNLPNNTSVGQPTTLAKPTVASYKLLFTRIGYDTTTLEAPGGTNLAVKMVPRGIKTAFQMITPNGGERFVIGDTMNIGWTADTLISSHILLDISLDCGVTWYDVPITNFRLTTYQVIITNQLHYRFLWKIPATLFSYPDPMPIPSTGCMVKVRDYNRPLIYDISDGVFTIVEK